MNSKNLCVTERKLDKKAEESLLPPSMYKIVLINDDYTPMEFVVEVLVSCFFIQEDEAFNVMLTVHNEGKAECGLYTKDVAETKTSQINNLSRSNGYPLLCMIERE
ncbi:MAG: ATP-dependent Clp protease adapter ClpS [Francisellaceae bacterium]|jgi:ATP-dependent Clp protease adaptor protein ClpS|nr:ATP-dependent Clp protease adapter ClpS [Francisellaceae bacterium]MBT6538616.1 ATP-dependent Clp protease adapter ClpS [Francisellaceae bacterium]